MRKEVTESVRERIMVIDNRVKELKSANVAGDDGAQKWSWDIQGCGGTFGINITIQVVA